MMKYQRVRLLYGLSIIMFVSMSLASCATEQGRNNLKDGGASGMVTIPGGWFKMGTDLSELNERPEHDVFVDAFQMDKYEVSASDFASFLNEKENPENKYFSTDEYSTIAEENTSDGGQRYVARKGFENYPANNVSWYGADAYCRWKEKRLPYEAEWEKAARGNDGRTYPWDSGPLDETKARYGQKWDEKGLQVMVPVDAMPGGASYYGIFNMTGNCREWIADWYRQNYCNYCDPDSADYTETALKIIGSDREGEIRNKKGPDMPPKYDPKGPPVGSFKVLRGGSWEETDERSLRSSYRYWLDPGERRRDTGFRCAK